MSKKGTAKGKRRQRQLEKKRQARALKFKNQGGKGKSKYARKSKALHQISKASGGRVFGFQFEQDKKPW